MSNPDYGTLYYQPVGRAPSCVPGGPRGPARCPVTGGAAFVTGTMWQRPGCDRDTFTSCRSQLA